MFCWIVREEQHRVVAIDLVRHFTSNTFGNYNNNTYTKSALIRGAFPFKSMAYNLIAYPSPVSRRCTLLLCIQQPEQSDKSGNPVVTHACFFFIIFLNFNFNGFIGISLNVYKENYFTAGFVVCKQCVMYINHFLYYG